MHGFQLWANLPAALKMTAPRYQEIKAPEIPVITDDDGTQVRLVCGELLGQARACGWNRRRSDLYRCVGASGPQKDASGGDHVATLSPMSSPERGSSATPPVRWRCPPKAWDGRTRTPPAEADNRSLILFDRGDEVTVQAGEDGIRFLLVSGKPLEEPVAWYGPIVMNTQEQLREAFEELDKGTFLKKG